MSYIMMFITAFSLSCGDVTITNLSDDPLNAEDVKMMRYANKRCVEMYDTCLSRFIKKTSNDYDAICQ